MMFFQVGSRHREYDDPEEIERKDTLVEEI
jgi:hypothetical protein